MQETAEPYFHSYIDVSLSLPLPSCLSKLNLKSLKKKKNDQTKDKEMLSDN